MPLANGLNVESETLNDFARVIEKQSIRRSFTSQPISGKDGKINLDKDNVKNGLAQLVLTVIKLLHELLERQAIRRIEAGSLTDQEIEKLGLVFMRQAEELERVRKEFGLEEEDLNVDLGPLGKLL
jgi:hypothetical protein